MKQNICPHLVLSWGNPTVGAGEESQTASSWFPANTSPHSAEWKTLSNTSNTETLSAPGLPLSLSPWPAQTSSSLKSLTASRHDGKPHKHRGIQRRSKCFIVFQPRWPTSDDRVLCSHTGASKWPKRFTPSRSNVRMKLENILLVQCDQVSDNKLVFCTVISEAPPPDSLSGNDWWLRWQLMEASYVFNDVLWEILFC